MRTLKITTAPQVGAHGPWAISPAYGRMLARAVAALTGVLIALLAFIAVLAIGGGPFERSAATVLAANQDEPRFVGPNLLQILPDGTGDQALRIRLTETDGCWEAAVIDDGVTGPLAGMSYQSEDYLPAPALGGVRVIKVKGAPTKTLKTFHAEGVDGVQPYTVPGQGKMWAINAMNIRLSPDASVALVDDVSAQRMVDTATGKSIELPQTGQLSFNPDASHVMLVGEFQDSNPVRARTVAVVYLYEKIGTGWVCKVMFLDDLIRSGG